MANIVCVFIVAMLMAINCFAAVATVESSPKIHADLLVTKSSDEHGLPLSNTEAVGAIGWVTDCTKKNLCCGYYHEPSRIVNVPPPRALNTSPMHITATKPAFLTQQGVSIVQGDVVLTQPGMEITADEARFFRDEKAREISSGLLIGHVNYREYGKLIVAKQSELDFTNKLYSLKNAIYRILTETPTGLVNAWGRAETAVRDAYGVIRLKRGTYTTCSPVTNTWHVWGRNITLDRNTGRGEVSHGIFYIKKMPILYTPYFNFPIDKRRESGFLVPTPSHSKDSGFGIDVPYYFNLAPNYDFTFIPEFFTKRGVLLDNFFRYLTDTSSGTIKFDYVPYDRAFADFKSAPRSVVTPYARALQDLKDSSPSRAFISMQNKAIFDEHWQSSLDLNYVTDDYFLQNFGGASSLLDTDQLLNCADISYAGEYWNFLGRLQVFQTLHPVTQTKTQDQYKKLPQIGLSGDFPDRFLGLDYRIDSELVNFIHRDDYYGQVASYTGGTRLNMAPGLSKAINWYGGYTIPRVQFQATGYSVHDQTDPRASSNITRAYPLISIDNGMVFSRNLDLFSGEYSQTLEPRLFYLLVPAKNQDDIPLFDTSLSGFDINQLFLTNRFSGIDRIGDANQMALALTSRLLDADGQEKAQLSLGQIVAFHKHKVLIGSASRNIDPLVNEYLSPVAGQLQCSINPKFNTTLDVAWDPNYHRVTTANAKLQYLNSVNRVMNFWYNYTLLGDQLRAGDTIDLYRVGFSLGWNVWRHWNIIGSIDYNVSYKRPQQYIYGIEYNSCCWAMRLVHSKDFIGIGADNSANYYSRIYLQILFKGFGDFGHNNLIGTITSRVAGYQDVISKGS